MSKRFVLALDQGTTSSRAILFDHNSVVKATAQREFPQYYPQPGWVEHDPLEIWSSQIEVLRDVLEKGGVSVQELAAIGITNQRETTLLWDRSTGKPIHNAIVWQCRRTAEICDQLIQQGAAEDIRVRTGLIVDAYFSGTKLKWLLDELPDARKRAERGELAFGTVDTWLLWNLTDGEVHATDVTNAARTMLFNINTLKWDQELLALLDIPDPVLPEVRASSGLFGETSQSVLGERVPIAGIAGDQHAALFGQACYEPGMMKNTYGTGCFLLANTGATPVHSRHRLLSTPAWALPQAVQYALEGSVFIAGAAVQWLRDGLELIADAAESESTAMQVSDSGGVYVVPAFVGLGAPHWDSYARGAVFGLTAASGRNHLVRATLESIAYQTRDVVEAMCRDRHANAGALRVDGGASANNFLMQFQADILGVPVERPVVAETTSLGAAYLAGLATGYWHDTDDLKRAWRLERRFEPAMSADERESRYSGWCEAVRRVRDWARQRPSRDSAPSAPG
jgi:glycerol kinase